MTKNIFRVVRFAVFSIVSLTAAMTSTAVSADGLDSNGISFISSGKSLINGYYLRHELMDQKTRTYSLTKWWESPAIFSEFDVKRIGDAYQFDGGNLHVGMVSFVIGKNGHVESKPVDRPNVVENKPCFKKFCISEIEIVDEKSFLIVVNGKEQKFMSTSGYRRVEPPEK